MSVELSIFLAAAIFAALLAYLHVRGVPAPANPALRVAVRIAIWAFAAVAVLFAIAWILLVGFLALGAP
jgi:hypothetical protein